MYSLGKKVKSLRKEIGLKQEELTCDILSRTMLSKIENDKVTPLSPYTHLRAHETR